MTVKFELPADVEQSLRKSSVVLDLDRTLKEAALVEMYRQEKLTQHELAVALSISRFEVEALLKSHNVIEDLPAASDLDEALSRLQSQARQ